MAIEKYNKKKSSQKKAAIFNRISAGVRQAKIYPYAPIDMLGMFAATCQKAEAETAFTRLLVAAVGAEPESYNQKDESKLAAIAILKRHPELLFVKGMVTDHFGRKIFGSPYQIFLGAGDVWALKQVHQEIIPKIKGGVDKAQAQFQEQFPNCTLPLDSDLGESVLYDDRNIAQLQQVKQALKKLDDAISDDRCTDAKATLPETKEAIQEFRQLILPKEGEVISTGLHFPIAILQEVFTIYNKQFNECPCDRLSLLSCEVIGAALEATTAVDGQCYKNGLVSLSDKRGPDRRDGLFCRKPKGILNWLTPLTSKIGRRMFVDPHDGECCFLPDINFHYHYWFNKNGRMTAVGSAQRSNTAAWIRRGALPNTFIEQKLGGYKSLKTDSKNHAVSRSDFLNKP